MWFLSDVAYAQGTGAPGGAPAGAINIVMIALFIGVMYFFFIRPQSKRAKEHRTFLESLKRGDKVVTSSGIYGTIAAIDDNKGIVTLEVGKETQIKFGKSFISSFQKTENS